MMRKAAIFFTFVLMLLATGMAVASDPNGARYTDDHNNIFWFVVISDTHVGEKLSGGDNDTVNLRWVTGSAFDRIRPTLILNCGDLVDATNGGLIPTGQHKEEWTQYRDILINNGMSFDVYVDMPGNHDQYSDKGLKHYLKYSIGGTYDHQTQHNVIKDFAFGKYQFVTTATCGNDGAPFPLDNASLDSGELNFIENALQNNQDSSLTFVFGHHPLSWVVGWKEGLSNGIGKGKKEFLNLMRQYHVLVYFYGHTHKFEEKWKDGILLYNVASLGKSKDKNFVIAAVDNNSLAVRAYKPMDWPYVLITAPADADLAGGNPYAYKVPKGWDRAPVRALIFDSDVVHDVTFKIDNGKARQMYQLNGPVWGARFDATKLSEGKHKLTVQYKNKSDTIGFVVVDLACSNGKDDDGNGLTDYPDDPGCWGPADPEEKGAALSEPDVSEPVADNGSEIIEDVQEADAVDSNEVEAGTHNDSVEDVNEVKEDTVSSVEDSKKEDDTLKSETGGAGSDSLEDVDASVDNKPVPGAPAGSCQVSNRFGGYNTGYLILFMLLIGLLFVKRRFYES